MSRSADRAFRNEATFRAANERIAERRAELGAVEGPTPFLCECEVETCTEIIRLSSEEYEQIRADPLSFVIVQGHETHGEETGFQGDGWVCVRKDGQ